MRIVCSTALSLVLTIPCLAQKTSIEGRVTNQAGEPLKNAVVTVFSRGPNVSAEVRTNPDGSFATTDLNAGRYDLQVELAGYLTFSYPSVLTAAAGQRLSGLSLVMTRAGLIAGRVIDDDGDPVPTAGIQIQGEGGRRISQVDARADGSFVVGKLPAGRYYLVASNWPPSTQNLRVISEPRESFVTTYYPDALGRAKATAVEVKAGDEIRDLEIHLKKARMFHIRGVAINADTGAPAANAALWLWSESQGSLPSATAAADGNFEFLHLMPDKYELIADPPRSNTIATQANIAGRISVTLAGDIDSLVLRLGPAVEVHGVVRIEGVGPAAGMRVGLNHDPVLTVQRGRNDPPSQSDGTFSLSGLDRGMYRVGVSGLTREMYIKAIHWADTDVTNADLDLTGSVEGKTLDILLSPHAAEIAGVVRDSNGMILADAAVTLWRNGTGAGFDRTDQNGAFTIGNLAPGEYKLGAWLSYYEDFKRDVDRQASVVKLSEGEHVAIDPPLISAAAK